jgi:hypothetical protein
VVILTNGTVGSRIELLNTLNEDGASIPIKRLACQRARQGVKYHSAAKLAELGSTRHIVILKWRVTAQFVL